jgi:hypothetical protein
MVERLHEQLTTEKRNDRPERMLKEMNATVDRPARTAARPPRRRRA